MATLLQQPDSPRDEGTPIAAVRGTQERVNQFLSDVQLNTAAAAGAEARKGLASPAGPITKRKAVKKVGV